MDKRREHKKKLLILLKGEKTFIKVNNFQVSRSHRANDANNG